MLGCEMISIIDYLLLGTQTNSLGFANKCQTPIADADHIEISIIHDRGSAVMSSKGFSSDLCYNTFERYTETSDPLEQAAFRYLILSAFSLRPKTNQACERPGCGEKQR